MDSKKQCINWMTIAIAILCVIMISIPVSLSYYEIKTNEMYTETDVYALIDSEINNYKGTGARGTRSGEEWPGIWMAKAPMSTKRNGLGVCVVKDKIYAIGGSGGKNITEEYDHITNTWSTKQPMSTARSHFGIGVVIDKIYVIGGQNGMNVTEEYDPATDTWVTKAPMPTSRFWFSVGVVNNKIYAIGGDDGEMNRLDIVEEYDPLTDSWATKASMPTPRAALAVGVVDGKIYAIGGKGPPHVNAVEMYDPETDSWSTRAQMPTGRGELAVGVVDGKIYAIGGAPEWTTNEEYNPITDAWSTKASMPTPRESLGIGVVKDKIYAIGGQDASKKVDVNEEFILDTNIDLDLDGLSNLQEFLNGTDPDNDDTDRDNLGDGFELIFSKTDPTNWDTNNNSIGDGLEFIQSQGYTGSMQSLSGDWISMTISWESYLIYIQTSSSVLEGEFNKDEQKLEIKVSGTDGTQGITDIDVPVGLCEPEDIEINLDDGIIDYTLTQNDSYYHIHIDYMHSTHVLTAGFKQISVGDDSPNYVNLLVIIILISIIMIVLVSVIKTRKENGNIMETELPPEELSKLLEKEHADGEITDETYEDIKSFLKEQKDR